MSEQKFNKKVQDYLKAKGAYVIKTIATNRAGVPDMLACYKGRFIGLEGKVGANKASALQLHHIEEIKKAGGIAGVVYTLEDVDSLLLELEN
jgi:Holliday junction resolvase